MCIRDRPNATRKEAAEELRKIVATVGKPGEPGEHVRCVVSVSYTHLRAHETVLDLVCRLLLEKKKQHHPRVHATYKMELVSNNTSGACDRKRHLHHIYTH